MWQDFTCPCCNTEIEIRTERYSTYTDCPFCEENLLIEFDMIYMEEENEEWDLHEVKKADDIQFLEHVDSRTTGHVL